jgi:2-polyprenyl-6-hydroxyphenyl methylase/3-demethylubiquinone-9 3-methyltransferase
VIEVADTSKDSVDSKGDTSADREFFEYYAKQSVSQGALRRFESIRGIIRRKLAERGDGLTKLKVADVGCNAGTQCVMWARDGHDVYGLDVNELLLQLARERAAEFGLEIDYTLGTAIDLPWADESMDVCLVPELLEHVADWRSCLDEFARVLKPKGILYLSTTNYLCPKQQEFRLPFYSWYPSVLKDRYERLAMSSRPELANYAKFPAVNWFSFYSLRGELSIRGMKSLDRFDLVDTETKGSLVKYALSAIRRIPPLRILGHILTPYTVIVGVKL